MKKETCSLKDCKGFTPLLGLCISPGEELATFVKDYKVGSLNQCIHYCVKFPQNQCTGFQFTF